MRSTHNPFWPQKAEEKTHLKCLSVSSQFEVEVGRTPEELWRIGSSYTPQHHAWSVCKLPPKVHLRHPIRKDGEKYGKCISSWDAQSHNQVGGSKKRTKRAKRHSVAVYLIWCIFCMCTTRYITAELAFKMWYLPILAQSEICEGLMNFRRLSVIIFESFVKCILFSNKSSYPWGSWRDEISQRKLNGL